jgi:flagellar basal body rod protein FlgB
MATLTIRQKLMTYLADADDSKIKAIYTLLESDIKDENTVNLTKEQLAILDKEREMHLSGQTKSYTRQEANQIIRRQRSF